MGFTRNYKNAVLCTVGGGFRPTTTNLNALTDKFDDTVFNTFKNVNGVIEYCTYNVNYGYYESANYSTASSYIYDMPYMSFSRIVCAQQSAASSSNYNPITIYFGTNDTAESIEDYTITKATDITFTQYPLCTENKYDATGITNTFQMVIQSSTDIILKEFGLFAKFYLRKTANTSGNQSNADKMLYRKVLDTPIELTANVPQLVTFDIHIPNIII